MKWIEADMTTLSNVFAPGSFDVVIDKAAMDALMCDEGDVWSPSKVVIKQAAAMCSGITSVLTPQGTFLQISFAQPHFRRRFLLGEGEQAPTSTAYDWDYSYHNIGMYVMLCCCSYHMLCCCQPSANDRLCGLFDGRRWSRILFLRAAKVQPCMCSQPMTASIETADLI